MVQPSGALPRQAWIFVAILTLGWGLNWPAMKIVVSEMPPWTFRSLCLIAGVIGLFSIARLGGQSLRPPRHGWQPLIPIALCNITCWNLFSVYGLRYLPAGRGAIIAYTMPVWTILLGRFFLGESLTKRRLVALALGMAGIALLLADEFSAIRAAPIGALIMLGASLSWALGTILVKRYPIALAPTAYTAWIILIGGIPVWLLTPYIEPHGLGPISHRAMAAVIYNLVIAFTLCYWAWQRLITIAPAGVSALSTLMIPVVGVLSSIVLLGERPGWKEFAALGLVVAALATVMVPPFRSAGALRTSRT